MKAKFLLLFLSTMFLYTSCDNTPEVMPELETTNQLLSFKIEKSKNADYIDEDIEGIVAEGEIKMSIPEKVNLTKLIATFTHNGESVSIGNIMQISAVTENDFSKQVIYTVQAEDGSKKDYTLNIERTNAKTIDISSFVFEKNNNESFLEEDIVGIIENNEIKLKISESINVTSLIATFTHNGKSVFIGTTPQVSEVTANDFSQPVVYTLEDDENNKKDYTVKITWLEVVAQIPHFYIETVNRQPVDIKEVYREGTLKINGGDQYEDFEGDLSIRGRGNSTWGMPKKPYRLKLKSKASLLGLSAEKDWILLQNYIDPSLMCNAVAMKTGQLLEMPFTHHIIPVDVTLNGEYIGSYTFTEHKEVEDNRINVGEGGWLIELDTYFDEEWKFYSNRFKLPVMIQYPELDKMTDATEAQFIFDEMKSDFNAMEELVFTESFPNNNYLDYFDAEAFVNFLIVYTLTGNEEINHPKSTYIYKKKGGKYNMGPIWDFDWAFGYEDTYKHFVNPHRSLFWSGGKTGVGTRFFSKFLQDPALKDLFRTEWMKFKTQKYPILVEYIKEYTETIRESHAKDQQRWGQSSGSIDGYSSKLLDWLDERVDYMDTL